MILSGTDALEGSAALLRGEPLQEHGRCLLLSGWPSTGAAQDERARPELILLQSVGLPGQLARAFWLERPWEGAAAFSCGCWEKPCPYCKAGCWAWRRGSWACSQRGCPRSL